MRVLHVINQLSGHGGAEVSLRDILIGTREDIEHAVVVLRPDGNQLADLLAADILCFQPPMRLQSAGSRWSCVRHVGRAIRSFQPDLVHTALFEADLAGRLAAKLAGLPTLTSLVNTPYFPEALRDSTVQPLKLQAVRAVDGALSRHATTAFHAISHVVADAAVDCLGINRTGITVVPRGRSRKKLGWPSAERRDAVRAALGLAEDAPVLINVARQEAQKGHTYLIDAFADVRRRHSSATLLLVGREGNRTPAIRRRVEELGVADAVWDLGVRADIGDLLCAADLFVFPSLYEGLGGAILEAMAMNVPIVASRAPALQEVLDRGRCGLLVPVADSRALAEAIDTVLWDPASADERTQAAQARFTSTYELSICLDGMRRLYHSLKPAERTVRR